METHTKSDIKLNNKRKNAHQIKPMNQAQSGKWIIEGTKKKTTFVLNKHENIKEKVKSKNETTLICLEILF